MNETNSTSTEVQYYPADKPSVYAQAITAGRGSLTRSFRLHRKRGGFCQKGWCQQCKVRLKDGRNILACQETSIDFSQVVEPNPYYRVLARLTEHLPPYFYHKRFLRPKFLRQFYLWVIRRMSAALPLPESRSGSPARAWRKVSVDTLVVGGGLSGMRAATLSARKSGSVFLAEADKLGGSAIFTPGCADLLTETKNELALSGVEYIENALCVGLYNNATEALVIGSTENVVVSFGRVIVATGAYDRMLTLPGNDLPGVYGVRALEKLLQERAIGPDARIGIYGCPAHIARALRAMEEQGIRTAWVASPSRLAANSNDTYDEVSIKRILGSGSVEGIALTSGQKLACEILIIGFSQQSYEVQMHLGQKASISGTLPNVVPVGETSAPMLVVGEAAGALEPIEAYRQVDERLSSWAKKGKHDTLPQQHYTDKPPVQDYDTESFVCPCEDVRVADIQETVRDGFDSIELIKRRTGAGTGPCQGKLCHAQLVDVASQQGVPVALPTMRPFARPIPLHKFGGNSDV